jgi:leader peptidase (prepilin peptidase) / N-methyltransferase
MISPSGAQEQQAAEAVEAPPAAAALDALAGGVGLVAAAAALVVLGLGSRGLVAACFLAALGVLAVIDFRTYELPNRIVLPAAAAVLGLQLALFPGDALEWVLSAAGCFALLLVLALSWRGSLGMGDAKLGLLLGAGLGMDVVTAMLVGCLALWPVAAFILARDGLAARKNAIPLGPALAFGAAVVTLVG